jgi:hypothetical protein
MAVWSGIEIAPSAGNLYLPGAPAPHATALLFPLTVEATEEFKMTGYYVAGAAYETWTAYGAPNTSPPSGHSLVNIYYRRIQ